MPASGIVTIRSAQVNRKHVIPVHLRSKMQQCSTVITATGPVDVVMAARRRKGVPQMRENGSPLQPGNAGNAATGPVAMVRTARRCKGASKRRENGSPLQPGNAGNAATGPVAMVRAARCCKGAP